MKSSVYILLFCLIIISCKYQSNDWENPLMIGRNKEKPHATLISYQSQETALSFIKNNSENYKLLNGNWKFKYYTNPLKTGNRFYKINFNDSKWDTIPVPSNWQILGYGTPIYTNIKHPFKVDLPKVPHKGNETGCYRTTFTIPENWEQKEMFIHFDGIQSTAYIYKRPGNWI